MHATTSVSLDLHLDGSECFNIKRGHAGQGGREKERKRKKEGRDLEIEELRERLETNRKQNNDERLTDEGRTKDP